jgi:DHA3 family tetracycline resistance protein-like MFS transporter
VEDGVANGPLRGLARRFRFLSPLAVRDYALLFTGTTISSLGDGAYYVAIAWQAYSLKNAPVAMTLVGLAATLPNLIFLLIGGVIADRADRRRVMIFGDLLRGLTIGTLGLLAVAHVLQLWELVVLVAVYSTGSALFVPASQALVPELVPGSLLGRANALLSTSRTLSVRIVGPALGGIVVAAGGAGAVFLIDAGSFVLSGVALFAMKPRPLPPVVNTGIRAFVGEAREGLDFVRRERWLAASLLASAIGLLFYMGPVEVLLPFKVKQTGGGAQGFGMIFAAGGVGAILASVALGQFGLPRRRVRSMYVLWAIIPLPLVGFGLTSAIPLMSIANCVSIGAMTGGMIIWMTLLGELVPKNLLGRVASVDNLLSNALVPLSMLAAGPLGQAAGANAVLVAAGLAGTFGIAAVFALSPSLRRIDT